MRRLGVILATCAVAACTGPDMGERYARWEAQARSEGRLRSDAAPPDAPFTNADLERNFARIALHSEFPLENGPDGNPHPITKWTDDITWSVAGMITRSDVRKIASLTARLEVLTGLKFDHVDEEGDIRFLFLDEEGRRMFGAFLRDREMVDQMPLAEQWSRNVGIVCFGQVGRESRGQEEGVPRIAMIGIPADLSPFMRESCVDEELVQTLGLFNDHPDARPSIFNDDEEFAFLTEHDEYLLRILYDDRLKPGMNEAEAMPIVRRILNDIRPEN